MYDAPLLAPGDVQHGFAGRTNDRLETGMVLNIETPYYGRGDYGLQPEDTVVVTDDGHRSHWATTYGGAPWIAA